MSATGDLDFATVLEVALGHARPSDINETQEQVINNRLSLAIETVSLTSLTIGPDPDGVQNRRQVDSLNHTVFYVQLEGDRQARFSMENQETSKKGTISAGELVIRLRDSQGISRKSVMSLERPWDSLDIIPTLRHLVVMFHIIGAANFKMNANLSGCRSWV